MPPTAPGLNFLEALTKYVDFRLMEKDPLTPVEKLQPFLLEFEDLSELLLKSRPGKGEAGFNHLMYGMKAMKTGGGGSARKPA